MNDFVLIGIILVFFALAALFVAACDRIIGPEEELAGQADDGAEAPEAKAA